MVERLGRETHFRSWAVAPGEVWLPYPVAGPGARPRPRRRVPVCGGHTDSDSDNSSSLDIRAARGRGNATVTPTPAAECGIICRRFKFALFVAAVRQR